MRIGRDGGDVSDADAVLMAMPGGAIAQALAKLQGIEGKTHARCVCPTGSGAACSASSRKYWGYAQ